MYTYILHREIDIDMCGPKTLRRVRPRSRARVQHFVHALWPISVLTLWISEGLTQA